jgi:hypothetical protein
MAVGQHLPLGAVGRLGLVPVRGHRLRRPERTGERKRRGNVDLRIGRSLQLGCGTIRM